MSRFPDRKNLTTLPCSFLPFSLLILLRVSTSFGHAQVAPEPAPARLAVHTSGTAAATSLDELGTRLQALLDRPQFSAAVWGVKIVSLASGRTLFERNADKLLKPASNAKLYTAALALDRLGPDYQIRTSVYAPSRPDAAGTLNGDLIVYGRGDPSFAARFNDGRYTPLLDPIVQTLAVAGVKRIDGDLIGEGSYFRGPPFGASWNWDDLQYYYGAEVSALTFQDNVIDLVFKPGARVGEPCPVTWLPETTFMTWINRTETAPKGSRRQIEVYRPVGENLVLFSGQLPIGSSNFTDAVTVHRPALWFVTMLKEALARRGVAVTGSPRAFNWLNRETNAIDFSKLVELGSVQGRPLRDIVSKTLKPSQNLYAQLLLLQVGAAREAASRIDSKRLASTETLGLAQMKEFLVEAGIKPGDTLLDEGSGLSRNCLVTPNATVQLLRFMSRHRHAAAFRDALPIAGVDGSLRNRMKQTKAAGNARAKTGSLNHVDALSGYVTTAAGEPLAFSLMLNNYSGSAASGREAIDSLIVALADFRGHPEKGNE